MTDGNELSQADKDLLIEQKLKGYISKILDERDADANKDEKPKSKPRAPKAPDVDYQTPPSSAKPKSLLQELLGL